MRPRYLYTFLISFVLLFQSAGFAQVPPATNTPVAIPDAIPASIPVIDGYTLPEIEARVQSALSGEKQFVADWITRSYGAYPSFVSEKYEGRPGGIKRGIVNPAALMVRLGTSHYRYPIFAYEETVPWQRLRDGMGMNENSPPALRPQVLKTLTAMGVTKVRRDVGWGNMDFFNPSDLKPGISEPLKAQVRAWKASNKRPLICLDTHPAAPCPLIEASVRLLKPLKGGDTSAVIQTRGRDGEVPTALKAGLSHITGYWAAEWLAVAVEPLGDNAYKLTFGKPLPDWYAKNAGDDLPFAYLMYRPFSSLSDGETERTYRGFQEYLRAVLKTLDSAGLRVSATDPGYDIEICNEMSNWTFRGLQWYTGRASDGEGDTYRIYRECVKTIRTNPAYDKLRLINGFHNQAPFFAQSTEPAGSSAGSNHFYRSPVPPNAHIQDVFGRIASGYDPATNSLIMNPVFRAPIVIHAPETIFSAEVGEDVVRAIAPVQAQWWGDVQGRGLRPLTIPGDINSPVALEPSGKPARAVELDFTEWSDAPGYDLPRSEQERLLARFSLRGHVVFIGKGGGRVYWYAALGPGHGFLSMDTDKLPPYEPAPVTQFKRLMAATKGRAITVPRSINVVSISDTHDAKQFEGVAGDPRFPALYNRDILLPQAFQLSNTEFMVSLHIMNKDYKIDLPAADYTVRWRGVKWVEGVSKAVYRDLLKTRSTAVNPTAVGTGWVEFTLPVTADVRLFKMMGV